MSRHRSAYNTADPHSISMLSAEFPALEMAALGFNGNFFQWLSGHLLPPSRMLCSELRSVKFGWRMGFSLLIGLGSGPATI